MKENVKHKLAAVLTPLIDFIMDFILHHVFIKKSKTFTVNVVTVVDFYGVVIIYIYFSFRMLTVLF